MKRSFDNALGNVKGFIRRSGDLVAEPLRTVKGAIGQLPYVGSLVNIAAESDQDYDEKHYLVIPFRASEIGYALHSVRCLPTDVPPINDLPKRRLFHLPHADTENLVRRVLLDHRARSEKASVGNRGDSLIELADEIDRVDTKVTNGMLLLGGLVAFLNPAVGLGIAARSVIPGLAGAVAKFGLRSIGKTVNEVQVRQEIRAAEKEVLREFSGSAAEKIVNPIIRELEMSLNSGEEERDPLLSFDLDECRFPRGDSKRLRRMTCEALAALYRDVLTDPRKMRACGLREKEVRWLGLICDMAAM